MEHIMATTRVKWADREAMTLVGESASGHAIIMDADEKVGGKGIGPRPMEIVLLGLGGCTAIDVLSILQKSRQPVEDCYIEISSERAEEHPKIFTTIHLHYVVIGTGIAEDRVARAVQLTREKYCSVSKMLEATVNITHDYVIIDPKQESNT